MILVGWSRASRRAFLNTPRFSFQMIISHKSWGRENPLKKLEADVLNPNHSAGLYPGSGYRTKNNASLSKPVECQMPKQLQGVNLRELVMGVQWTQRTLRHETDQELLRAFGNSECEAACLGLWLHNSTGEKTVWMESPQNSFLVRTLAWRKLDY